MLGKQNMYMLLKQQKDTFVCLFVCTDLLRPSEQQWSFRDVATEGLGIWRDGPFIFRDLGRESINFLGFSRKQGEKHLRKQS